MKTKTVIKKAATPSKLVPMVSTESLGDIPTHFMKSGSCIRPEEDLNTLQDFKNKLLPEKIRGANLEYDVWFNTNELKTIRKWLYTDFLGTGIYIRVNSIKINDKLMFSIIDNPDQKIDWDRIMKIKDNLKNKYILQPNEEYHDKVIFLPGSNLLSKEKVVHYGRIKKLVDQGYKIKPHPITVPLYLAQLRKHFGAENILGKKVGGMELLMNCTHVATMPNSEMGLIALLLDKPLSLVSYSKKEREKNLLTYESLYHACSFRNGHEAILKLFSAKNSGMIFSFDEDAEERLERYVANFWEYKIDD